MLIPSDSDDANKEKLVVMLKSCKSLQALEIKQPENCIECRNVTGVEDFLISHLPSLEYVRISYFPPLSFAYHYTLYMLH